MKNTAKLLALALCMGMFAQRSMACTNIIVGKKASTDGSVMVSYNADSYGCYGVMQYYPAGKHAKGEMRKVYDWENGKLHGEIEEAAETYNVVGNINEFQLCIGETTFGGREELVDTTGILDYGSLIYITLQRARTAREAIDVMTKLVEKYGYNSEGETFSIADPNEAWIMEMVGKGPGGHGAVWVAVRVPDDCVCAHANQSRIHRFSQYSKKECLYSKDVVSFARKQGLYEGKDADFDFAATYCPLDFGGARYCEARVWSFYNRWTTGMNAYLDYAMGKDLNAEPMPLFVKPKALLSVADVQAGMRDQYEGTPMQMTDDVGAGAYLSPYRPRPLAWEYEGKKYFNERPIGTQQTSFAFVAQMRDFLPNPIGGVIWFGNDDANMVAYTPVYCCSTEAPACYTKKYADEVTFSFKSAFWVCNMVANMVYQRYSLLYDEVKKVRDELEKTYFARQKEIEDQALTLYKNDPESVRAFLTDYSVSTADEMLERWLDLAKYLIVKYNDNVVRPDDNGKMDAGRSVINVGYPDATKARIVKETGDRYAVPEKNKQ